MANFFVRYRHGPKWETVGLVMTGFNGRDVARQIREKHRDVDIEAIKAVGDGTSKRARRW